MSFYICRYTGEADTWCLEILHELISLLGKPELDIQGIMHIT